MQLVFDFIKINFAAKAMLKFFPHDEITQSNCIWRCGYTVLLDLSVLQYLIADSTEEILYLLAKDFPVDKSDRKRRKIS